MTQAQRIVLIIAAMAVFATIAYPPFEITYAGSLAALGHAPMWAPPDPESWVSRGGLITLWIGIGLIALFGFLAARRVEN